MAALHRHGVPVGVAVAPVIPGWNDHRIPAVLQRARDCGAEAAFLILLRLPAEVHDVFVERLRSNLPQRADKVLSLLGQMRPAGLQAARFGRRMRGEGARWRAIEDLFAFCCRRLSLRTGGEDRLAGGRPQPRQRSLFGD
jgi:DNA repair photolyase